MSIRSGRRCHESYYFSAGSRGCRPYIAHIMLGLALALDGICAAGAQDLMEFRLVNDWEYPVSGGLASNIMRRSTGQPGICSMLIRRWRFTWPPGFPSTVAPGKMYRQPTTGCTSRLMASLMVPGMTPACSTIRTLSGCWPVPGNLFPVLGRHRPSTLRLRTRAE